MIAEPALAWVLTILYAALASHALWAIATAGRDEVLGLTDRLQHVVMALGMIAMCWPWWNDLPALPTLAVYAVSVIWCATRVSDRRVTGGARRHHALHLVMALAMVWMVVVMPPGQGEMTMMGLGQASAGIASIVALIAMGAIVGVDAWIARATVLEGNLDAVSAVAMAAGMAIMCWLMMMEH